MNNNKNKDLLVIFLAVLLGCLTGLLSYLLGFEEIKVVSLVSFISSVYWIEKLVSIFK